MEEVHVLYKEDKLCIEFHNRPVREGVNKTGAINNRVVVPQNSKSENIEENLLPRRVYLGRVGEEQYNLSTNTEESSNEEESLCSSETEQKSSEEEIPDAEPYNEETSNESISEPSWTFYEPSTSLPIIREAEERVHFERHVQTSEEIQVEKVNIYSNNIITKRGVNFIHNSEKENCNVCQRNLGKKFHAEENSSFTFGSKSIAQDNLLGHDSPTNYDSDNVNEMSSECSDNETTIDSEDIENELSDDEFSKHFKTLKVSNSKKEIFGNETKNIAKLQIKISNAKFSYTDPSLHSKTNNIKQANSINSSERRRSREEASDSSDNSVATSIRVNKSSNDNSDIESNYETTAQICYDSENTINTKNYDSDYTGIEDSSSDSSEFDTETIYSESDLDDPKFLTVSELHSLGKQNNILTKDKSSKKSDQICYSIDKRKSSNHSLPKEKINVEKDEKCVQFEKKNVPTQHNYSKLQLLLRSTQKHRKPTKKQVTNIRPIRISEIFRKL